MIDIKTPQDHIILVPMDFSDSSINAVYYAVEMANFFDSEVTLLHVISKSTLSNLLVGKSEIALLRENLRKKLANGVTRGSRTDLWRAKTRPGRVQDASRTHPRRLQIASKARLLLISPSGHQNHSQMASKTAPRCSQNASKTMSIATDIR